MDSTAYSMEILSETAASSNFDFADIQPIHKAFVAEKHRRKGDESGPVALRPEVFVTPSALIDLDHQNSTKPADDLGGQNLN